MRNNATALRMLNTQRLACNSAVITAAAAACQLPRQAVKLSPHPAAAPILSLKWLI
jgi:hypothetical protein